MRKISRQKFFSVRCRILASTWIRVCPFRLGFIGSPTTWSPIGIAIRDGNGDEVFLSAELPDAGVFAQHKVDGSLEPPPVLVSNTGLGHFRLATDGASAQGFHTGGSAPAEDEPGDEREVVTVHSVGILVEGCSACPADPAQARVRVYRAGPNAYTPAGEPLFALSAPASVATSTVARFTAPEDAVLRADADYHLVFDDADGGTFPWALPVTNGDAEDAHSQPGWTIEDVRGSRLPEGSVWTSRTFVAARRRRWRTSLRRASRASWAAPARACR